MILQANAHFVFLDGIGCERHIARSDRVEPVYQLQYHIHRIAKAERPVVLAYFLIDCPCLENPWVWLTRNADARIGFAVLEQDVIVGLILLDEVILQQEGILLAIHYHIAYISYMRYELACLAGLMVLVEIAVYPSVQVLGFTDIDNLSVPVVVLVHTRLLGYALQQECNMIIFFTQLSTIAACRVL